MKDYGDFLTRTNGKNWRIRCRSFSRKRQPCNGNRRQEFSRKRQPRVIGQFFEGSWGGGYYLRIEELRSGAGRRLAGAGRRQRRGPSRWSTSRRRVPTALGVFSRPERRVEPPAGSVEDERVRRTVANRGRPTMKNPPPQCWREATEAPPPWASGFTGASPEAELLPDGDERAEPCCWWGGGWRGSSPFLISSLLGWIFFSYWNRRLCRPLYGGGGCCLAELLSCYG